MMRNIKQIRRQLFWKESVLLHLGSLEQVGERERFFAEHNMWCSIDICFKKTKALKLICEDRDWQGLKLSF